ncbi:hypothetical protein [Marinibactrum halimedae]|uniref:Uncharacterized protein n=1 Tax=Marinibactrum halimedae TaxID=1444977 RepID=A0AA37WMA2_9GAMM|nr:hypothetical protein [Marinibactrum halimedae]MCD9459124.1 hypothetical protein [Marinibactrum halimedae]GLS24726.1 hypothetical protein GCM10007877_04400 [Marinibactrum halimedae]
MTKSSPPQSNLVPEYSLNKEALERQWLDQWQAIVDTHFLLAHERVDPFFSHYFLSVKHVWQRHWRHKADIPQDLLNLPKSAWRLCTAPLRKGKTAPPPLMTRKEKELTERLQVELLALPTLHQQLFEHLQSHPTFCDEQWSELQSLLSPFSEEEAHHQLSSAINRLTITQEGGRDFLLFISLGIIGRGLSDKVAFGSAMTLGSSAATGAYMSQQGFFGGLWASWFGVPGWVSATGAVAGFGLVLIATPLLSPLTEVGINRIRGRKALTKIVDEAHQQMGHQHKDLSTLAGHLGTFMQMLPDVVQLLKHLKP